ncbi:MAG: hypothetical protein ACRCT6_09865 [Notoacmeibacter sp.]
MSDQPKKTGQNTGTVIALDEAIREVRLNAAERGDVVVELREASRARMELLVSELEPTIQSVPADDDQFDFALSSGQNPRLFVDATAHVGLARDRMTYRFVRDSRLGRVVLEESRDLKIIADRVTRYVAERIVERQRMMDGPITDFAKSASLPVEQKASEVSQAAPVAQHKEGVSDFMLGLIWFLIGGVAGAGGLYLWLSGYLTSGG